MPSVHESELGPSSDRVWPVSLITQFGLSLRSFVITLPHMYLLQPSEDGSLSSLSSPARWSLISVTRPVRPSLILESLGFCCHWHWPAFLVGHTVSIEFRQNQFHYRSHCCSWLGAGMRRKTREYNIPHSYPAILAKCPLSP